MTTDFQTSLRFKGLEYKSEIKGPTSAFRQIMSQNDTTEEDILSQYDITNDQLYQQQQRLYSIVEKARSIGIKDSVIRRALRGEDKSGLNNVEITNLMNGKFTPFKITSNMVKKILTETVVRGEKRTVERLPVAKLLRSYQSKLNLSLEQTGLETATPKRDNIILKPSIIDFENQTRTSEPTIKTPNLVPSEIDFSNITSKPSTKTRTDPAFLGSNPVDILKNLAIGTRTQ